MNPHKRWTHSDIAELRGRLASGDTPREIAELLTRAPDDVAAMMSRLRLRHDEARSFTPADAAASAAASARP